MSQDADPVTVQIDAEMTDAGAAERAAAEVWERGACGVEERTGSDGLIVLRVWAPAGRAEEVRAGLEASLAEAGRVGPARPVVERDWSRAWHEGLGPVRVSQRVTVRPSFAEHRAAPGECVLVVDPAQAFGTGHHASTRLALSLLDDELAAHDPGARVLDVGTGSGVVVLAALALGAGEAVGFDLDPLAAPEARRNARANALTTRARFFTGPIEALKRVGFDVVVANLLRSELLPLLDAISDRHVKADGALVLSGLLASDRALVEAELTQRGLRICAERDEEEGGDTWLGLLARPEARA